MRLEVAVIPTEETVGQPFWTLYEQDTGAPVAHKQDGEIYGILFFSKKQAQTYFQAGSYGDDWVVRGLSQENLRTCILTVDAMAGRFLLAQTANQSDGTTSFLVQEIARHSLISEFYVGSSQIPDEPMVMPSIAKHRSDLS
jgi:hypothetical protein